MYVSSFTNIQFGIYEEPLESNNIWRNNPIKMDNRYFTNGQKFHETVSNIVSYQRNANGNPNKVHSELPEMRKKWRRLTCGTLDLTHRRIVVIRVENLNAILENTSAVYEKKLTSTFWISNSSLKHLPSFKKIRKRIVQRYCQHFHSYQPQTGNRPMVHEEGIGE